MKTLPAAALLCIFAPAAFAQSAPAGDFYVGVDVGLGRLDRDAPWPVTQPGADETSEAWKARFGYRVSRYFAVETSYTDFGDYKGTESQIIAFTGIAPVALAAQPGDITTTARGAGITLVGSWPVGSFQINGSLGYLRREIESSSESFVSGGPTTVVSDWNNAVQFGVGLGYELNERFTLGLDWSATNGSGERNYKNDVETKVTSLGLRVRF